MTDLPSMCLGYLDEPEEHMTLEIENLTDADIYLLDIDGCGTMMSLFQLQSEGGSHWPRQCGGSSCEWLLGAACLSPWCDLACHLVSTVRLPAGAVYREVFPGRIDHEVQLTDACTSCDTACWQARKIESDDPIDVVLRVDAAPECTEEPCHCEPGPEGWCHSRASYHAFEGEAVVLTGINTGDTLTVAVTP